MPQDELTNLRTAVENPEAPPSGDVLGDHWQEYEQAVDRRMHPQSLRPMPLKLGTRLKAAFHGFVRGFRQGI